MQRTVCFTAAIGAFLLLAAVAGAESLRGPLDARLIVTPVASAEVSGIGVESIVLVDIGGDPRFLDAIDLEITSPAAVADMPGAVSLYLLGPINVTERDTIADVVGEQLLLRPLTRGGTSFFQIVLHDEADPDASPAVTRLEQMIPPRLFPIAISVVPRMKGISDTIQNAEFSIAVRPVTRDLGAIAIRYVREDGTVFDGDGPRAPEFELLIDESRQEVANEYLLEPGLHRIRLRSERYQDQEITVGVERGRSVPIDVPLRLALASVNYTAPRGSSVYVNGRPEEGSSGDFTVPPGEHTIVVILGDYTVTRRFAVEEQKTYSISVTMDIVMEEIK